MESIPNIDAICELFEPKPNTWEKARPFLRLALILAPGAVFGSFDTLAGSLSALDSGLTLAGAMDELEAVLFHTAGLFRKKPRYDSPFDLPRLANTLAIYAAWFDTLSEQCPTLWENLELDDSGWQWMKDQCQAEYDEVREILGGDGRNILLTDGAGAQALNQFYAILMDRTRKLASGLAATENLSVPWNDLPEKAVRKYFRHCEVLRKYEPYRSWVGEQYLNQILRTVQNLTPPPPRESGKLHLPPVTSLEHFRGRQEELETIRSAYHTKKVVTLWGEGGMGKTELAIAYAAEYENAYFFPFRNDLKNSLTQGFLDGMPELAQQRPSPDVAYAKAVDFLKRCAADDLLILDNVDISADSLDAVRRELEKLPLRCLITTRTEASDAIEVGTLQEEELALIFDDQGVALDHQKRIDLIRAVDRHTLTVDLIARSLRGGRVDADAILNALKRLNLRDVRLPKVGTHYSGSPKEQKIYGHLLTVFNLSGLTEPEKRAMTCAVLLPQTGMNGKLFQDALDDDAADALFDLAQRGWLRWNNGRLSIHPLIRILTKTELEPTDEKCGVFLKKIWEQYDKSQYNQEQYKNFAELFAMATNTLDDVVGEWAFCAGVFWNHLGEYRIALAYNQKAVEIGEKALPDDHPDLAIYYNNLGSTYGNLGNHNNARIYKEKALEIRQKILPENHPDLAVLYNNIGVTYNALGRINLTRRNHEEAMKYLKESLKYHQSALELWKKILPKEHSYLATCYNNLGNTYGHLGDHIKALEYQQNALAICEKVLPENHPDIAVSCGNIAITLTQLDRFTDALPYIKRAVSIAEQSLPENHPDLLNYRQIEEAIEHYATLQKQGIPFL